VAAEGLQASGDHAMTGTALRAVRTPALICVIIVGAMFGESYVASLERHDEVTCTPTANGPVTLQGLDEASGLAFSQRTRGILWSFNDSGEPLLYALDTAGRIQGRVAVTGAAVKNWEAITVARCGRGPCLYVADIGDNKEKRPDIVIYRVPEPLPSDRATAPSERLVARYADGPHDAEALFFGKDGALYIITKDKPALVYKFPETLQTGAVMSLERVAVLPMEGVTDAETSPDGEWIAVRSKEEMIFFRNEEFILGEHGTPVNLRPVGEPQGEGIAIADNGTVYLASEGKHRQTGTLRTMQCRFPTDGGSKAKKKT
jgi:hypothetical protein